MADNVAITAGSGTNIATDDDGTAHHQLVKVEFGPNNTQTAVTTTTGLPTQGTGTAGSAAGGVLTVQGVASMTPILTTAQASTNLQEIAGDVAEDQPLAGNPVRIGGRASSAVPTAMSGDGDIVSPWYSLEGAQIVQPRLKQLDIQVTPTIDTAVYASGDRLGSVMTFANAALVSGGTGTIVKAVLHDEAASNFEIWLHLFKVSPTLANADNGVLDITDANLATAIYVATIKFLTADTKSFSTSNRVCEGTWLGGPPAISYTTSGSSSLFGVLEARGAYDAAATDDIIVTLSVIRD